MQASAARRGRGGEEGEERDLGDDDDRERQPCQGGSAIGVDEHTGQHRTEGRSRGERAGEDPDPQRAAAWWHDPLRQRQCEGKHAAGETLQGAGEDQLGEGRRGSGEEESERDDRKDEEQDAPRRVIVAKPADNRCGDRRDDERRGEHPGGVCGCRAEELGGGGERGCRHRQREGRADRGEHEAGEGAYGPRREPCRPGVVSHPVEATRGHGGRCNARASAWFAAGCCCG